jgi:hypothetical protein
MNSLGIPEPLFFRPASFAHCQNFSAVGLSRPFERGDADRDWLGLRDEAHAFKAVAEAATKNVRTNGDARSPTAQDAHF